MTLTGPPVWTYIVLCMLGIIQILASVLVGILISRLSGMKADVKDFKEEITALSEKLGGLVADKTCLERKKVICNKIKEHKKANKADADEFWQAFHGHGHAGGKVTRSAGG